MKIRFAFIARGMVWLTLPLMVGLGYWEHHLPLPHTEHKLAQMLLVVLLIGWAAFWNVQGEYDRLRRLLDCQLAETKGKVRLSAGDDAQQDAPITTSRSVPVEKLHHANRGTSLRVLISLLRIHLR